jgi:hypothetical protein
MNNKKDNKEKEEIEELPEGYKDTLGGYWGWISEWDDIPKCDCGSEITYGRKTGPGWEKWHSSWCKLVK